MTGLQTEDLTFFLEIEEGINGPYTVQFVIEGDEILTASAVDNSDTTSITIQGVVLNNPPTISQINVSPRSLEYQATLNIGCRAADPDTVVNVWADIRNPSGGLIQTLVMTRTSGNNLDGIYNITWDSSSQGLANNYYVVIRALDGHATDPLEATSANQLFNIVDTTDPQISGISYNTPVTYGTGTLSISCDVTDNHQLRGTDPVEIQIRNPSDGILVDWTAMTDVGGDTYSYSWELELILQL